jgi:hypothetical protein
MLAHVRARLVFWRIAVEAHAALGYASLVQITLHNASRCTYTVNIDLGVRVECGEHGG